MWPAAFILEFFVVEKLSKFLAFRIVSPTDKPIFIILASSSMIVCPVSYTHLSVLKLAVVIVVNKFSVIM